MKSHWANYKKEKENALVYEDENGFFSAVEFEDWFYCDEVYVVREKRDKGVMKAYEKKAAWVFATARKRKTTRRSFYEGKKSCCS